jgi:fructose-1,6-bisphosphatase I
MYECNALAFVVEQAGGKASTGQHRIMEIIPGAVHDRCQLYIGSKSMVEKAESFITPDHSSSSEL